MKHGGDLSEAMRRHGGGADVWLDLSTGINPWPWPVPEIARAPFYRLPSRDDIEGLLAAARQAYGVPDDVSIAAGPGTQALIQWLPRLASAGPVSIATLTYSEHARAFILAGHDVIAPTTTSELPPAARHAVVVNPNNPDGRFLAIEALRGLAAETSRRGGWLIIDESFGDVGEGSAIPLCGDHPVVVLRSFGKFYGLPGLRLGFAVASHSIASALTEALGPWAVAAPAIAIGTAALRDHAWALATRERLQQAAAGIDTMLADTGLSVIGGTSLFRLVRDAQARVIHEALAARHIWTRIFPQHPDLLRFGLPPDRAALDRLRAALSDAAS